MALDDLLERAVPADIYVPARVSLLKLLGKGEPEAEMVRHLLPRGGRAIDVGANKGTYATYLVAHFDRVEAFEPIPRCASLLRRFGTSKSGRLTIHECALGSEPGQARLAIPERQSALFSSLATAYAKIDVRPVNDGPIVNSSGGMRILDVPVRTLDAFDFADVRFVKIDVEGFEASVLLGAERTIRSHRPLLLVEIEQRHLEKTTVSDVVSIITQWNYDVKFLEDGKLRDFDNFIVDFHQPTVNGEKAPDAKRYVNNFFFFPR